MRKWLLISGMALSALAIACGADSPATAPTAAPQGEPAPTATEQTIVIQTLVVETVSPITASPEATRYPLEPVPARSPATPVAELIVTRGTLSLADDGGVFAELLGFLPDTVDTRKLISIRDFIPQWEAAAELGFERPDPDGDPAAIEALIRGVVFDADGFFGGVLGEAFLCCPRDYIFSHQPLNDIGFDTRNVDSVISAGLSPREFTVVQGIYDPAVTAARLDACGDCVPHEVRERNGLEYYRWNDDGRGDLRDRFAPPLLDHIGRGGRIHVGDGFAMHSYFDADMEGMIDVVTGNGESLIELEEFQLASRAIASIGKPSASMASSGFSMSEFDFEHRASLSIYWDTNLTAEDGEKIVRSAPLLAPFTLVAALSTDEQQRSSGDLVLILVHETEEQARINLERLPGRLRLSAENVDVPTPEGVNLTESGFWGDFVGSIELSLDGKVLFARLTSTEGFLSHTLMPYTVLERGGVLIYE